METKAYRISRAERKKIETHFGEAKHILSMVRLRLRAPSVVRNATGNSKCSGEVSTAFGASSTGLGSVAGARFNREFR